MVKWSNEGRAPEFGPLTGPPAPPLSESRGKPAEPVVLQDNRPVLNTEPPILKPRPPILKLATARLQYNPPILQARSSHPKHKPIDLEATRPAPKRSARPRPRRLHLTI